MKKLPKNAYEVMVRRYALRGKDGKPVEKPEDILERVAAVVSQAEYNYRNGKKPQTVEKTFLKMLYDFRFVPNGRTLANAGAGGGQLANCFVLPIDRKSVV